MAADTPDNLPPALRAFLHSCIESITQVELLMMLRGSERMRTARETAAALGVSTAAARSDLETLTARGLLEVNVGEEMTYRYRPRSEELAGYCDLLARHYVTARPAVFGFIATTSHVSIKRFADAFKLRDPEK